MKTTSLPSRIVRVLMVSAAAAVALTGCPETPKPPPPPPAAPTITLFSASASQVVAGEEFTLTWATENAVRLSLNDSTRGVVAGVEDRASGELSLSVQVDTLFVLTAENENGVQDTALVAIDVKDGARTATFVASPNVVTAGGAATLAWDAPGAVAVSLATAAGTAIDVGTQRARGSVTVHPEVDTTYVLTVDGRALQASVTVRPVVHSFEANPTAAKPGDPIELSWTAAGGSSLRIESLGRGLIHTETDPAKIAVGSFTDALPPDVTASGTVVYLLVVEGSAKTLSGARELTVLVGDVPVFTELKVPRFGREGETFELSWRTLGAERVEIRTDGDLVYTTPTAELAAVGQWILDTPTQDTVYTIRAVHPLSGEATETRRVGPVGTTTLVDFSSNPTTVVTNGGDAATLTWNVPNARNLRISVRDGMQVYAATNQNLDTGSVEVYPNGPTEYVLVADNTFGESVTASLTLDTTHPAGFEFTPSQIVPPQTPLTVSWAVPGGTEVYGLAHSDIESLTGEFIDISTTGTKLAYDPATDDVVKSFDPGFVSWMWGSRVSGTVFVSENGHVAVGATEGTMSGNFPLPSENIVRSFYAPYWEDLIFHAGSGVFWQLVGTGADQELVIQWEKLKLYNDDDSEITFQMRLHPTGMVTYAYKTLTSTRGHSTTNSAPLIGVQEATAMRALTWSGPVPAAGTALRFFGPKTAPLPSIPADPFFPVAGFVKVGDGYIQFQDSPRIILPNSLNLTEVMYRPAAGIATTGEWLELYNTTNTAYDLAGYTLDFGNGVTHVIDPANGQTLIQPLSYLVLGQSNVAAQNDGVNVGYVYGTGISLDDNAGTVTLINGSPLTSISWTAGQGGEGVTAKRDPWPAMDGSGTSMPPCSSTEPFGTQTPQQLGTPGTVSGCFPYALQSIPAAFESIKATGTVLLSGGSAYSAYGTATLPAPFTFFGQSFTEFNVSTVGFTTFGPALGGAYDTKNDAAPVPGEPDGMLAVFWDEIARNSGGGIYMERKSNYTIISWENFRIYGQSSTSLNFQQKLFDDGTIEFHYGVMDTGTEPANRSRGSSATAWIEKLDGTAALPISVNTMNGILPNSGFRFTPY